MSNPAPQTLVQKIIARSAGRTAVAPGEIVMSRVDLVMFHDSSGPRRIAPRLERLGAKVWDPSRIVLVTDHFVPPVDVDSAQILDLTRRWARDNGIAHFYDMQGICHVVLQEGAHLQPGMFAVGGDSHSTSGGAFGCYMAGIGATEMTGVVVTGEIWTKVPETVRIDWTGRLPDGVSAKDMMLFLCARLGMDLVHVAEFAGEAVTALPMRERMVLANMAAELGAETGLIAPDRAVLDWLAERGRPFEGDIGHWAGDADAPLAARHEFDAAALAPQVAAPHSPENSAEVGAHEGVAIDQAYIGACTGAKITDLHMAARILAGRRVAPGIRLLVAPASARTTAEAVADGTLATLVEAGAILLPTGCGACAGYGAGVLAAGEVCIASTARNFRGRMGSKDSLVYLGSPYTVAAAAVAGHITDPRPMLAERRAA